MSEQTIKAPDLTAIWGGLMGMQKRIAEHLQQIALANKCLKELNIVKDTVQMVNRGELIDSTQFTDLCLSVGWGINEVFPFRCAETEDEEATLWGREMVRNRYARVSIPMSEEEVIEQLVVFTALEQMDAEIEQRNAW